MLDITKTNTVHVLLLLCPVFVLSSICYVCRLIYLLFVMFATCYICHLIMFAILVFVMSSICCVQFLSVQGLALYSGVSISEIIYFLKALSHQKWVLCSCLPCIFNIMSKFISFVFYLYFSKLHCRSTSLPRERERESCCKLSAGGWKYNHKSVPQFIKKTLSA